MDSYASCVTGRPASPAKGSITLGTGVRDETSRLCSSGRRDNGCWLSGRVGLTLISHTSSLFVKRMRERLRGTSASEWWKPLLSGEWVGEMVFLSQLADFLPPKRSSTLGRSSSRVSSIALQGIVCRSSTSVNCISNVSFALRLRLLWSIGPGVSFACFVLRLFRISVWLWSFSKPDDCRWEEFWIVWFNLCLETSPSRLEIWFPFSFPPRLPFGRDRPSRQL